MMAETTSSAAVSGPAPKTQAEWEKAARALLEDGQNFLAHDVCRDGLRYFPNSFDLVTFGAIALSQTGAVDEARRLLAPVLDAILIDEGPFRRLQSSLKSAIVNLDSTDSGTALAAVADLAEAIELVRGKKLVASADAGVYGSLARVFREAWLSSGQRRDLEHCRELSLRAFNAGGNPREGIEAAVMSVLLHDSTRARSLAQQVRDLLAGAEMPDEASSDERYRLLSTLGQAYLLLGEGDQAVATFTAAKALEGVHYSRVVGSLQQIELLRRGGVDVPAELADIVKPPTVVVFTGHPLDRPGEGPHFPPGLEMAVRAEIAQQLDELDAQVGYSMASCGSDLLFIEAMLERGAEVNVVMPFAQDDFIAESVRYGGPRWEMRFRNALKLAASVTYATEERYLGHEMLYRFANQCLHGLSTLRAGFLHTTPYLLAVWDMMPGSLVGGAGDFIDQWEDISRLRIIDLDGLLQQRPDLIGEDGPAMPDLDFGGDEEEGQGRVIRSMLFCDIAGYSKLKEEHIPAFLEFLTRLKDGISRSGMEPKSINTWGDAIFAVMDKATPMAEYAMTMQEVVTRLGAEMIDKLPNPLNLRISLHAGPVFEAVDPIRGNPNFYGSHINRAARLEPVTVVGHVYATQQFVAVLTAEQSALRSEAVSNGGDFVEKFVAEYVGVLSLAKDFGKQTVYHLRRKAREDGGGEMAPEADCASAGHAAIIEQPAASVGSVLATVERMIGARPGGPHTAQGEAAALLMNDESAYWPGG
jgi:class 3 adenylate cyclase